MKTDKHYLRVSKETSFTENLNFKDKMIFYKLADSFNKEINLRIEVAIPTFWKITENLTYGTRINTSKCSESQSTNYKNKVSFDISNFTCLNLKE